MTTKTASTTRTGKLTVSLSAEVGDALKEMAVAQGTSVTEQLRRAVSVHKWLYDVMQNRGARILIEDPRAGTREVELVGM